MIERGLFAGVPGLLRPPAVAQARSLIVLWHGFGPPDSERAMADALPLDDIPSWKAYLGLPLFGQRLPADGERELALRQREDYIAQLVAPVVEGAAAELADAVRAISEYAQLPADRPLGVLGFSAGGAAAMLAVLDARVRIDAAVLLNALMDLRAGIVAMERVTGTPYQWTDDAHVAARRLDFSSRVATLRAGKSLPALLFIHGERDEQIDPEYVRTLYRRVRPIYDASDAPDRLRLEIVPGLGHYIRSSAPNPGTLDADARRPGTMRTGDAHLVAPMIADWFRTHLSAHR